MYFRRFYDTQLAQASYLIGCQRTGEAVVVDPNRDVQPYMDAAEQEGLRITHVTETHIHADYVSGARELAHRTGAQLLLSDEGDANWKYRFAATDGARLLRDGDHFMVGNVRFDVMHTPGHTPEHLSFLVTDSASSAEPWGVLTGDFVFVGDVGRPDLLERAAGYEGTMEEGARTLFRSLKRFRTLPDHVQLWPGHGAGSACGKQLGAVPSSTVGYEKLVNWGVAATDEAKFVHDVLEGQPEPPSYFAQMKRINKEGPRILGGFANPPRLPNAAVEDILARREVVVDTRTAAAFAAGHLPGTLSIPLGASFTTWAGWLLPYNRDIHLLIDGAEDAAFVAEVVRNLAMIGLDRVAGILGGDVLEAWTAAGHRLATTASIPPAEAARLLERGEATVVDVRGRTEWESGHIPGAVNVPVGYLAARSSSLPDEYPLIVQCQSGARSAIAASVLQSVGIENVLNLTGGIVAWESEGLAVVHGSEEQLATAPAMAL